MFQVILNRFTPTLEKICAWCACMCMRAKLRPFNGFLPKTPAPISKIKRRLMKLDKEEKDSFEVAGK